VEKLFEMIQGGLHGCSVDEHTAELQEHVRGNANNHHGLDALFSDPTFPSVLPLSEFIGYERLQR
jgi:hypothetical protein